MKYLQTFNTSTLLEFLSTTVIILYESKLSVVRIKINSFRLFIRKLNSYYNYKSKRRGEDIIHKINVRIILIFRNDRLEKKF